MNYLDIYLIFMCVVLVGVFTSVVILEPMPTLIDGLLMIMCAGELGLIRYVYFQIGIGAACVVSTVLICILFAEMLWHTG